MSTENEDIDHSHIAQKPSTNGRMVTRASRTSNVIENEEESSEAEDYFGLDYSDTDEVNYREKDRAWRDKEKSPHYNTHDAIPESSVPTVIPSTIVGLRNADGRRPETTSGIGSAMGENSQPDELRCETGQAQSPRTARRQRNRLAAARMRTRQKQHLAQLEKRKEGLERRAAQLEEELRMVQRQNSPFNSSIDKLAEMIDDLTRVEHTMLTGIDECKSLLQNLESLCEFRQ